MTTQGELETTPIAVEASAGRNSATDTPEETLETGSGKIAPGGADKQDGERAETGEADTGEAGAMAAGRGGAGHGRGAGVSLCSWERKGLRPLLEVRFSLALPFWGGFGGFLTWFENSHARWVESMGAAGPGSEVLVDYRRGSKAALPVVARFFEVCGALPVRFSLSSELGQRLPWLLRFRHG